METINKLITIFDQKGQRLISDSLRTIRDWATNNRLTAKPNHIVSSINQKINRYLLIIDGICKRENPIRSATSVIITNMITQITSWAEMLYCNIEPDDTESHQLFYDATREELKNAKYTMESIQKENKEALDESKKTLETSILESQEYRCQNPHDESGYNALLKEALDNKKAYKSARTLYDAVNRHDKEIIKIIAHIITISKFVWERLPDRTKGTLMSPFIDISDNIKELLAQKVLNSDVIASVGSFIKNTNTLIEQTNQFIKDSENETPTFRRITEGRNEKKKETKEIEEMEKELGIKGSSHEDIRNVDNESEQTQKMEEKSGIKGASQDDIRNVDNESEQTQEAEPKIWSQLIKQKERKG